MIYLKACLHVLGCLSLAITATFAQDQKVADSLALIYRQEALTDSLKLFLLTELSFNETRDLNKGLMYAEELIKLSEKLRNNNHLRKGYFLKGTKKRLMGQFDEALKAYFKSAEIARILNYPIGEGEAYGGIGDTYSVAGNHHNATHYYSKALSTLRRAGTDSINLASLLSNIGDEFFNAGNYDSALLYFIEAKLIFDQVDYLSGKGYCLGNIGMVYASIGKNNLAEKNITEAILILEETQDYYPICVYLISMAEVYLRRGDSQTALNYSLKSLQLAEQHGLKEQIAEGSLKLSELYERLGKSDKALMCYKKHIAYRDSIHNVDIVQKMADLRTEHEVSKKQIEVNMLNKEKQNHQTIVAFLYVILGLAIMLLGTLYWFYRYKSKEKMRLHQQELLNARMEIQEQTYRNISQELHDNIGQALSLVKININTVDIEDSRAAREKLTESKNLLVKAIQDLRDMSKTLNADFINEVGLAKAIDQQLQLLKRTGLYSTELSLKGDVSDQEPGRELLVFRIVQELLNNIVKHAEATQIRVVMNFETNKLVINVWDNGKGFDIPTQPFSAKKGLGLRNIYNRLKLIKGSIFFESEVSNGTTATIEIVR